MPTYDHVPQIGVLQVFEVGISAPDAVLVLHAGVPELGKYALFDLRCQPGAVLWSHLFCNDEKQL